MKKIIHKLTLLLALAMMLSACSHEHVMTEMACNLENHWYICGACGDRVSEPHTLDEDDFCKGCGFTVYDIGDGAYSVMGYDEHGATAIDTEYDADGNVKWDDEEFDVIVYADKDDDDYTHKFTVGLYRDE